tara:strand:- start:8735 stop:10966 length:2232 start_codon:yes stop_codon:yes gene_type:complete
MYKFIFTVLFSLICFSNINAEIIKKIDISGNVRVSDETIKIYGEIKLNSDYNEQKLNSIINNLYSTNFFEDVKIELSNSVLKIYLVEYPVINNLIILGEPKKSFEEQIRKIISLKNKDSFIKSNLSADVDKIKTIYSSIGYNFTNIETKVRKIDKNNVDLIYEINRGEISNISKIYFTGDKKIRERRLRDIIASEEDKFWKFISKNTRFSENLINLDLRLLENYYKSIGYYDVKVSSNSAEIKKAGNIELTYSIDAGERYTIKKITTNVDSVFDKNLFYDLNKEYKKNVGTYYSPFKIKKLLDEIDRIIEKNNLQFVEHNVEEIIEAGSIVIKFNVVEGEKITVERINIKGNNITNESVIRAELELDEGDPFTKLRLDKSIANLKSRNIFGNVESKVTEGSTKDLKNIDIEVEEKATGELSAGAGIGTNGGTLGFNVQENNWLGEGKKIGFQLDVDKESLRGTLSYTDPNYDFLGNAIGYSVSSVTNDRPNQGYENSLLSAGVSTSFEQYKDLYTKLGLSVSYDDLTTDGTASDSLKKQSGEFSEVQANYGFTYDKRDRSFMPTDGSIASFNQSFPIYADKNFISNSLSYSTYKSFNEDVVGAGKFFFSAINGLGEDNVRLSKRTNLSSRRLRGFERGKVGPVDGKDHIGGNFASSLNFEASLPKILPEVTKTDVILFLDFANVWGVDYDSSLNDSNKLRSSTGAAASWLSPVGPMTFVLSTNLSKATTDETQSFNFNLGTTF